MELTAYLTSLSFLQLFSRMPAAAAQGILWGLMALGVFITFRVLDIADLTVDGSFATGGAVTVMLLLGLLPGIKKQYLLLSVFGGASHNIGQLIAARFIINNSYVWYYLPVLLAAGLLMGAVTGLALRVILPYLNRLNLK